MTKSYKDWDKHFIPPPTLALLPFPADRLSCLLGTLRTDLNSPLLAAVPDGLLLVQGWLLLWGQLS